MAIGSLSDSREEPSYVWDGGWVGEKANDTH
jgi:hypothetical protein